MVRMKATWILVVSAAIASGVFTGSTLRGQSASPAAGEFEQDVLPVLSRNCIRCHNDRLQTGKLSLEAFRDGAAARQRADVWQKVLDKMTAGRCRRARDAVASRRRRGGHRRGFARLPGIAGRPPRTASAARSGARDRAPAEPRRIQQHDSRSARRHASPGRRVSRSTTRATASTTSATCCRSRRC